MEDNSKKNLLLGLVITTSFLNPFMGAATNIALPKMGEYFGMNAVTLSWVAMSFLLSSAVFMVPLGKLADILGRRKIFIYGNLIIAIASTIGGTAQSVPVLLASRVIQGLGSAMVFGTGMAIITSTFPPHERGKAIGINVTAVYLGLSASPILGGLMTQYIGWRSIFLLSVPVGLGIAIMAKIIIKTEWAEARHEKFDIKGAILYMFTIALLMYGFSKLPDLYAIAITAVGLILFTIFIKYELKQEFPVMNINLFKNNKLFAYSNLAALINYAATFAISFVLNLYLQYVKGLSPKDTGMLLIAQPAVMALVASFAGRLSDKYDSRILSSLGMGIIVVGLLLLVFIDVDTHFSYIIFCQIILGMGFGLFSSPNTNAVMGSVEKKFLGIASATIATMRLLGQMMSIGIATMIIHIYLGSQKMKPELNEQFHHSTQTIFIVFTCLCVLGVWASLKRNAKQ